MLPVPFLALTATELCALVAANPRLNDNAMTAVRALELPSGVHSLALFLRNVFPFSLVFPLASYAAEFLNHSSFSKFNPAFKTFHFVFPVVLL